MFVTLKIDDVNYNIHVTPIQRNTYSKWQLFAVQQL